MYVVHASSSHTCTYMYILATGLQEFLLPLMRGSYLALSFSNLLSDCNELCLQRCNSLQVISQLLSSVLLLQPAATGTCVHVCIRTWSVLLLQPAATGTCTCTCMHRSVLLLQPAATGTRVHVCIGVCFSCNLQRQSHQVHVHVCTGRDWLHLEEMGSTKWIECHVGRGGTCQKGGLSSERESLHEKPRALSGEG